MKVAVSTDPAPGVQPVTDPAQRPLGVIVSLFCLGWLIGLGLLMLPVVWTQEAFSVVECAIFTALTLVLPASLFIGIRRGHPLARRLTVLIAGTLIFLWVAAWLVPSPPIPGGIYVFLGAMAIYSALRSDASWRYFGHSCPYCNELRRWPSNLVHTKFRCKACGIDWNWRDQRVNTSVFD
ncbi:MAG: hypothetical protein R3F65_29575 [bacterium]